MSAVAILDGALLGTAADEAPHLTSGLSACVRSMAVKEASHTDISGGSGGGATSEL